MVSSYGLEDPAILKSITPTRRPGLTTNPPPADGHAGSQPGAEKMKKIQLPTIAALAHALKRIKPEICDDYRESPDDLPSIAITLAADSNGYAMQTGDNSYTGPAYSFQYWGIGNLYRRTNTRELARDLIEQCRELAAA